MILSAVRTETRVLAFSAKLPGSLSSLALVVVSVVLLGLTCLPLPVRSYLLCNLTRRI